VLAIDVPFSCGVLVLVGRGYIPDNQLALTVPYLLLSVGGMATDIPGLEALLRQKTSVATEIAAVEQRPLPELAFVGGSGHHSRHPWEGLG